MRRSFLWLVFFGSALVAVGQVAPDIETGTPADAVLRTYGWPKGKSTTGGRESWIYDRFQVLLENGKVVSVTPLLTAGKATPQAPSARPPAPAQSSPKRGAQPVPSPAQTKPPATKAGSAPAIAAPLSPPPVTAPIRPPSTTGVQKMPVASIQRPLTPKRVSLIEQFMPVLISIVAVMACALAGLVFWIRQRQRRASSVAGRPPTPAPKKPQTFEEHIAERLGNLNGGATAPPPLQDLTLELLRALEWKRFELFVARYFAATGLRAECTCIGADGGIDVKLYRNGETAPFSVVQCKAWGSETVGVTLVRELRGVMAAENVGEGVFVTTSDFTPDARAFASKNGILALNAGELLAKFALLPLPERQRILTEVTTGDYTTPTCPQCDTKMVWKPAQKFWGCPRYPRCRSKPIHGRST